MIDKINPARPAANQSGSYFLSTMITPVITITTPTDSTGEKDSERNA